MGARGYVIDWGNVFLKNWAIPGLFFLYFRLFNSYSKYVHYNILPMPGFELRITGIGSDRSANWPTTTATDWGNVWRVKMKLFLGSLERGQGHLVGFQLRHITTESGILTQVSLKKLLLDDVATIYFYKSNNIENTYYNNNSCVDTIFWSISRS